MNYYKMLICYGVGTGFLLGAALAHGAGLLGGGAVCQKAKDAAMVAKAIKDGHPWVVEGYYKMNACGPSGPLRGILISGARGQDVVGFRLGKGRPILYIHKNYIKE